MSATTGTLPRFYGSFLELALSAIAPAQDNVWAAWTTPGKTFTFATARRALQWLVDGLGCARIWLPAYICTEVPAALARHMLSVPCDQRMTPEDMHHVGHEVRKQLMK